MRQGLWPEALVSELAEEAAAFFAGQGPLRQVLICESDAGEPIGMIELSLRSHADGCRSSPVPFVEGWYVMAGQRRKGAGSLLMEAAEAWAREPVSRRSPRTRNWTMMPAGGPMPRAASKRSSGRCISARICDRPASLDGSLDRGAPPR